MAALVGLHSRCQIDMRCAHRLWAQAGSLRTSSRPFIGRRYRLAQGVYTLAFVCLLPGICFEMPNPGSVSQPGLALLAPEPPARRALRHTLPVGARAATAARVDESFDSTAVQNGLKMGPQSVFRRPVVLAVVR